MCRYHLGLKFLYNANATLIWYERNSSLGSTHHYWTSTVPSFRTEHIYYWPGQIPNCFGSITEWTSTPSMKLSWTLWKMPRATPSEAETALSTTGRYASPLIYFHTNKSTLEWWWRCLLFPRTCQPRPRILLNETNDSIGPSPFLMAIRGYQSFTTMHQ